MRLRTFVVALTLPALLLPTAPARAVEIETIVSFDADRLSASRPAPGAL